MIRILLVNPKFTFGKINYGGVNKMILWLGNNLAESGYDVTFCTVYDRKRSDRISHKAKSIELSVPYRKSIIGRYIVLFTVVNRKLKKVLALDHYDFVVSFDGLVFFVLLLLRNKFGFKFIVSERADPNYDNSKISTIKRRLYKYVDVLVCQTESAKKSFSSVIQNKSVVIPNSIQIPQEKWRREEVSSSIASVGRLHIWQKRQDILLRAFKKVIEKYPNYILNLYGTGPDELKLKKLSKELRIDNKVVFNGAVSDVNCKLIKNELFVITSDFEGIPNALLEAMALGIPVISTKCSPGGAELLIEDGVNGSLADCGDEEAIANLIINYIENPRKEETLGRKARISMERFAPNTIFLLWEKIFQNDF